MLLKICLLLLLCLGCRAQSREVPLKVVTEPLPPFQIVKNGQVIGGMSTEIVQALLDETDTNADIRAHNWARTYKIAQEQPNILIFSLGRNARRENQFKWVGLIYNLENYFWRLEARHDIAINSLDQVKTYRTAVARENLEHQLLLQRGFVEPTHLVVTSNISHAIGMVFRGRADLYLGSKPLIVYTLKGSKYHFSALKPLYQIEDDVVRLSIAFSRKTDDATVVRFQQAYQVLIQNGTYDRIVAKWQNTEYLD